MPAVVGVINGVVIGVSDLWFNVIMAVAVIGGVLGGFEHVGARSGLVRGLISAASFSVLLLITFEARGVPLVAKLVAPLPIMAVVFTVVGGLFGVLGGWLRGRSEDRRRVQLDPG